MNKEEFNEKLLREIIICKEKNELTDAIQELFIRLIKLELSNARYIFLTTADKNKCEIKAYFACYRSALNINLDKTVNAYSYIGAIIRCSFAKTVMKLYRLKHESKST